MSVFQADSVEITILVENWVDMLLPDLDLGDGGHCVRSGLIDHFDSRMTPPQAENGISLLVRARSGRHESVVLFDAGLTGTVLLHNLRVLEVDASQIQHVVISHGHPDHYGGLYSFLDTLHRPMPVSTGSGAFLPRYAVMGDGRTAAYYNQTFTIDGVERRGGLPVLSGGALDLGCGIYTTGFIPRSVPFEGPVPPPADHAPGLYQVRSDGTYGLDEVLDEQGLVIDVRDAGLVVLTGCAHAGVLNTIDRAREICGPRPVTAVLGGFHLGFPTTPRENVDLTAAGLREREVSHVVPMHCSGLHTHTAFSREMPERYVQPAVGTVLRFGL
ncbi:MBL fold metallo-hydrolase [Nocardioides pocheonensis]|uniref:MBL fold metallo-hydrolase n=1 Tax=Nocardioides pocheonensis TaxID=661485 RepID=A0A3N0GKE8_9ACTN|nr:MBL fold metallo-hydrolase [Nocardioides pocheonensis]RNM12642.1 MBL fold metallo-hydrolase [Nocardioides pocheonensis]